MAKLILTEEERAAAWDGLSDETVGKIMKQSMFAFEASHDIENDRTPWYIKLGLISWAVKLVELNAWEANARLDGVTYRDQSLGDWEITLRRVDEEPSAPVDSNANDDLVTSQFTIQADELTAGKRLSTAWALLVAGLRCLFLGRMGIVVSKEFKLTGVNISRGPERP